MTFKDRLEKEHIESLIWIAAGTGEASQLHVHTALSLCLSLSLALSLSLSLSLSVDESVKALRGMIESSRYNL